MGVDIEADPFFKEGYRAYYNGLDFGDYSDSWTDDQIVMYKVGWDEAYLDDK